MSELQSAIKQSIAECNIDLMLPKLLEAKFFMVCFRESEEADPEIFFLPSQNPDQICITVSEDHALLEGIEEDNPQIVLAEISGDDLLGIVADAHEIMVVFDDGGYCIPRDHIDWWYSDQNESE